MYPNTYKHITVCHQCSLHRSALKSEFSDCEGLVLRLQSTHDASTAVGLKPSARHREPSPTKESRSVDAWCWCHQDGAGGFWSKVSRLNVSTHKMVFLWELHIQMISTVEEPWSQISTNWEFLLSKDSERRMIRFSIPELSVMIGTKTGSKQQRMRCNCCVLGSNAEQSLDACICLFLSLDVFGAVNETYLGK